MFPCYTLEGNFCTKKSKKQKAEKNNWTNYWLLRVRRTLLLVLLERDYYVEHWKVTTNLLWRMTSEISCSLISFKNCLYPCVCIIRHFKSGF